MSAFTGSFFKSSLSFVALLAVAASGACNSGDIPIGTENQPISCTSQSDCPSADVCAAGLCAQACSTDAQCPAGQVCTAGACEAAPACALTTCGTACVDTQTDPSNCGGCGEVCAPGTSCAAGVCDASACTTDSDCPAGQVCASGECTVSSGCTLTTCGTACVDLQTDPNNCGACGVACPSGDTCVAGACSAPACTTDSDCPSGETCMAGVCTGSAATCDPLPNAGCQAGFSCQINIPYFSPSDISCRPAGTTPPDAACSPSALCAPGSGCVLTDAMGDGNCRQYCDLTAMPAACPAGDHCASIMDPTIGICVP